MADGHASRQCQRGQSHFDFHEVCSILQEVSLLRGWFVHRVMSRRKRGRREGAASLQKPSAIVHVSLADLARAPSVGRMRDETVLTGIAPFPTFKRGANEHRAYGTSVLIGPWFPTLKRGANELCAYGAVEGEPRRDLGPL